jgi:hypothetical protein
MVNLNEEKNEQKYEETRFYLVFTAVITDACIIFRSFQKRQKLLINYKNFNRRHFLVVQVTIIVFN